MDFCYPSTHCFVESFCLVNYNKWRILYVALSMNLDFVKTTANNSKIFVPFINIIFIINNIFTVAPVKNVNFFKLVSQGQSGVQFLYCPNSINPRDKDFIRFFFRDSISISLFRLAVR